MKYKLVQKGNPSSPDTPKKWYASAVSSGKTTQGSLSKEIAGRSSLTKGDISSVIMNLVDELPTSLLEGRSVKLDGFGTFRISLSSAGSDTKDEFNTNMIKQPKILFTPSSELKQAMSNMTYERQND